MPTSSTHVDNFSVAKLSPRESVTEFCSISIHWYKSAWVTMPAECGEEYFEQDRP